MDTVYCSHQGLQQNRGNKKQKDGGGVPLCCGNISNKFKVAAKAKAVTEAIIVEGGPLLCTVTVDKEL